MTKERITTADGTYWVDSDDPDAKIPTKKKREKGEKAPRDPGARDEYGIFAWIGRILHVEPRTAEWLAGILVAVVGVAITTYLARQMWFTSDEWEYLANRTAFDLGDLTRPVGGHWTTWSVLLLRGLYRTFGVDFWPWFYIPRLIGHTLLVTFIWRVMRHRGADPLIGIVAYAVLVVLGASGYQRALQVGNWAVYAALIICALVIARRPDEPTTKDKVIVAAALLVAVLGNGYAVAVIGGITVTLLFARKILAWIPSMVPAVIAYGIWYLHYRDDIRPKPEITPHKILEIPWGAFRVIRTAVDAGTGLPTMLAAVGVIALMGWIAYLIYRRKFDLFDSILLCTFAIGLCLLVIQRISIDDDAATRLRYGYSVSVLLIPVLVPQIRLAKNWIAHAAVIAIGLVMVVANIDQMKIAIDVRADVAQEARLLSVQAAGMIRAGEPQVAGYSTLAHGLEIDELAHLVADGYDPAPLPEDTIDLDLITAAARGAMRMSLIDQNRPRAGYHPPEGEPVQTDADVDDDGCVVLTQGDPITGEVTGAGLLTFQKTRAQSLQLTWTDEYGEGVRYFDDPDIKSGAVELAEPTDTAQLELVSPLQDLTVCGFAPA